MRFKSISYIDAVQWHKPGDAPDWALACGKEHPDHFLLTHMAPDFPLKPDQHIRLEPGIWLFKRPADHLRPGYYGFDALHDADFRKHYTSAPSGTENPDPNPGAWPSPVEANTEEIERRKPSPNDAT